MKVWAFMYNHNFYESSARTESLHLTKEGAEKAMAWHKENIRKECYSMYGDDKEFQELCPFGFSEHWDVIEMEVLP